MKMKDFINLGDFGGEQLRGLLEVAIAEKAAFKAGKLAATLGHRTLAMIFEKASLRTRVSFEAAMTQLGGHAICLTTRTSSSSHAMRPCPWSTRSATTATPARRWPT